MPRNGSGTYTWPPNSFNPATSGNTALPADWNASAADAAAAISNSLAVDGQATVTANIPLAGFKLTGVGNPTLAQDAATKTYVDASQRSYLAGLTLSNDGVSPNTVLDIAAGFCVDSTNAVAISLGAFTKSTAGLWAAGTGNNGMGNGLVIANSTWYHVFAIIANSAADVYFDTSITAANKPAATTAFRRVGSFLTNGSAQIIAFIQNGDRFDWLSPVQDIAATGVTAGAHTATLASTPTGIVVEAILSGLITDGTNFGNILYISALAQTDNAPTSTFITAQNPSVSGNGIFSGFRVMTNTNSQIRYRTSTANTSNVTINTNGWIDTRGRNA